MATAPRDHAAFLSTYNLPPDALEKCGLSWELLDAIAARYGEQQQALHSPAASLAERLRQVKEVHSVRVRIKEPDHLVAKIIRKTLEGPHAGITAENFASRITDLLGLRPSAVPCKRSQRSPSSAKTTSSMVKYLSPGLPGQKPV